jgi:hypothetical protein
VRASEVVEELLVGGRLLERVQLRPVEVLQQRVAQQVAVVRLADDRRDRRQARRLRRAPATLAHDELVPVTDGADDDRLQHADLADGSYELVERLLVEHRARLTRVGTDRLDRQLREPRTRNRHEPALVGRLPSVRSGSVVVRCPMHGRVHVCRALTCGRCPAVVPRCRRARAVLARTLTRAGLTRGRLARRRVSLPRRCGSGSAVGRRGPSRARLVFGIGRVEDARRLGRDVLAVRRCVDHRCRRLARRRPREEHVDRPVALRSLPVRSGGDQGAQTPAESTSLLAHCASTSTASAVAAC